MYRSLSVRRGRKRENKLHNTWMSHIWICASQSKLLYIMRNSKYIAINQLRSMNWSQSIIIITISVCVCVNSSAFALNYSKVTNAPLTEWRSWAAHGARLYHAQKHKDVARYVCWTHWSININCVHKVQQQSTIMRSSYTHTYAHIRRSNLWWSALVIARGRFVIKNIYTFMIVLSTQLFLQ